MQVIYTIQTFFYAIKMIKIVVNHYFFTFTPHLLQQYNINTVQLTIVC